MLLGETRVLFIQGCASISQIREGPSHRVLHQQQLFLQYLVLHKTDILLRERKRRTKSARSFSLTTMILRIIKNYPILFVHSIFDCSCGVHLFDVIGGTHWLVRWRRSSSLLFSPLPIFPFTVSSLRHVSRTRFASLDMLSNRSGFPCLKNSKITN
jgi:hypothetical protein